MTTISLAGVTFKDYLDGGETGWAFTDLTNWWGVPDSKSFGEPIPQQHGTFDPGVDWRDGAVPFFKAVYVGATEAEALAALEDFNSFGTSETQQVMTVTDVLRATSREVSIRSAIPDDHHGKSRITVPVYCSAADLRRYGADVVTSTGLPVSGGGLAFPVVFPPDFGSGGFPGQLLTPNAGKQATQSRFTVSGGLSDGFSLIFVELGREIRFEFPLSLTDVVTIDQKTGRAWINDEVNSVTGFLTKSEYADVPAGGSLTVQFNKIGASTGTPTLTAYTPPAYL